MNILKFFLLIFTTVFVLANSNENNSTSNVNNKKNILNMNLNQDFFVQKDIANNELIDWKITIGNGSNKEKRIEGNFKIIDILGNIINENNNTFRECKKFCVN